MKRILCLCLSLLFLLCACAKGEGEIRDLTLSPLIQTASEGGTRLLATRDGFLVLWERGEGFAAGFVSPKNSVLVEEVFAVDAANADPFFLETETGKGLVAAGGEVWYLLLDQKGAQERALADGVAFSGVFWGKEGLVCQKDELLLLVPADLSETLVLGNTTFLPEFDAPLTVSADGNRLWYLRRGTSGYTGIGAFRPGDTRVEQSLDLAFDRAVEVSPGKVLLVREGDSATLFTYMNLDGGVSVALTLDGIVSRYALSPAGDRLVAWQDGAIRLYDFSKGQVIGELATAALGEVSAFAFSADGQTVLAALQKEGEEVLVTLT